MSTKLQQEKFALFIKYTDIDIDCFKIVSEADKYKYSLPYFL